MKKILLFLFCMGIPLSLVACGSKTAQSDSFDTETVSTSPSETCVAENEFLKLEWDQATNGLILTDKDSQMQWSTTPSEGEQQFDEYGMPIKKHPMLNSILTIDYLDYENNTVNKVLSYTGAVQNGRVCCENGENSLLLKFYFDDAKIMIPVQYTLKDESLEISIKTKEIQEDLNQVVSVSVAPFFCSAKNDTQDTYLFVPSGSGTLIYPKTLSNQGEQYSSQVYGYDSTIEMLAETTEKDSVRLPVYGVRSETGKGMCAIITKSEETAEISVSAGASAYGYSSVYAKFNIRGYTSNVSQLFSGVSVESTVYSKERCEEEIAIEYFPLTGEDATYMGMANVYKEYLKSEKGLERKDASAPFSVTMIGGITLRESFLGIPYDKFYTMTTLSDAKEIADDIQEATGQNVNVLLKGYGSTGVDYGKIGGNFTIHKDLGSKKELAQLDEHIKNAGSQMYFDFDIVRFRSSGNGFSTSKDGCYDAAENKADKYLYNVAVKSQEKDTAYTLLKPKELHTAAEKVNQAAAKLQLSGISLESLTSLSYSNYHGDTDTLYIAKSKFASVATDAIQTAKSDKTKLLGTAANAYAAVESDILTDVPVSSDGERIFSVDIPFYQMVFAGSIPMYVESVNLNEDGDTLMLQAIEGGCGISYTLIQNWNTKMISTNYPLFYSSVYENLKEDICTRVEQISGVLEKISDSEMVNHTLLTDNVRKTEYANGVIIYVNYGDLAAETADGTVEAHSYLIKG